MEDVQKHFNPKCNIALPALCRTDNLNCLLGWSEELHTLRKQYREAERKMTELENKYQAAKKIADGYELWAEERRHIHREWKRNVVGFQNVLQEIQDRAEAALEDSAK